MKTPGLWSQGVRLLNGGTALSGFPAKLADIAFARERKLRYYETILPVLATLGLKDKIAQPLREYEALIFPEVETHQEGPDGFRERSVKIMNKLFRSHFLVQPTVRDDDGHATRGKVTFVPDGIKQWRDIVKEKVHAHR